MDSFPSIIRLFNPSSETHTHPNTNTFSCVPTIFANTGTQNRLNGCINDAKCMEYMLTSKFGFTADGILLMTDDHPDPLRRPTKQNIFNGWTWLLSGMQPGDSLVFHYSGHGGQKRDMTGEEVDGMNETLCPMDFQRVGEITDDEVNQRLVNPLVRLFF